METPIPNPRILVRVCVRAVTAGKIKWLDQDFRNSFRQLRNICRDRALARRLLSRWHVR
jgi:hypothetical protein